MTVKREISDSLPTRTRPAYTRCADEVYLLEPNVIFAVLERSCEENVIRFVAHHFALYGCGGPSADGPTQPTGRNTGSCCERHTKAVASSVSLEADLLGAFEDHSPDGIRKVLADGVSPTELIEGKLPIDCLIEMYRRSPRFAECLEVMLNAGAKVGDPVLEAILLDDDARLRGILAKTGSTLSKKLSLLCAFTSCRGVSPLHICAEFNSIRCMRILLENGADVNARADQDSEGTGGHTPIFHAVNSIFNYCRPAMEMLVDAGADLDTRVKTLLWGESMNWETVLFDITPISYAQCGLYRQFHRREEHIYSNIEYLYGELHGVKPPTRNVPNKYLTLGH